MSIRKPAGSTSSGSPERLNPQNQDKALSRHHSPFRSPRYSHGEYPTESRVGHGPSHLSRLLRRHQQHSRRPSQDHRRPVVLPHGLPDRGSEPCARKLPTNRVPVGTHRVRPRPARFEPAGYQEVSTPVPHVHLCQSLAGPDPSGGTSPSRRCQDCSHLQHGAPGRCPGHGNRFGRPGAGRPRSPSRAPRATRWGPGQAAMRRRASLP